MEQMEALCKQQSRSNLARNIYYNKFSMHSLVERINEKS